MFILMTICYMFNSRHVQTVRQDLTMADQNGTCTDTLTVQPLKVNVSTENCTLSPLTTLSCISVSFYTGVLTGTSHQVSTRVWAQAWAKSGYISIYSPLGECQPKPAAKCRLKREL